MNLAAEALPGPRAFLSAAAADLARCGSLVLHLPRRPPSWLLPALEKAVGETTGVRSLRLDVSSGAGQRSPSHVMATHVMPGATRIRTVAGLLSEPAVSDAAFVVSGIPEEEWAIWTTFRRSFDRERARLAARPGAPLMPFLLLCAPPGPRQRAADGAAWLGCMTRLDGETAASCLVGRPRPGDLVAETELAVAVEIAGWDVAVLEALLALPSTERMEPDAIVARLAGLLPDINGSWAGGGLDLWDGDPFEHPSLVARRSDEDAIAARVLHGQLRVVFPFLDRVRRAAIARDLRRLALQVPFKRPWDPDHPVLEVGRLEFKDILHLLTGLPALEVAFLKLCRDIRNALAHGRPVSRDYLVALDTGWRRLGGAFVPQRGTWR
jgi:hypothetical protein